MCCLRTREGASVLQKLTIVEARSKWNLSDNIYWVGTFFRYVHYIKQSRHGQHSWKTEWSKCCHCSGRLMILVASLPFMVSWFFVSGVGCSESKLYLTLFIWIQVVLWDIWSGPIVAPIPCISMRDWVGTCPTDTPLTFPMEFQALIHEG